MTWKLGAVFVIGILLANSAGADTVYLKNGVRLDGQVGSQVGNIIKLHIGHRITLLREDEVLRVEKNDKTGVIDRQALIAAAQKRADELTKQTGLTTAQRQAIQAAMALLITGNPADYAEGIRRLVEMGANAPVFDYLANWVPAMLPRFVPGVLDAMCQMDLSRARPTLLEQCTNVDSDCRAKTLQLLARVGTVGDLDLLARGLVDPSPDVQVTAAGAVAELGGKRATPALIANLASGDGRVRHASQEALVKIWSTPDAPVSISGQGDWQTFWQEAEASVGHPIDPAGLRALVEPGSAFIDE